MQAGGPVLAEHLLKDFRTSLFLKKKKTKKKLLWNAETFLQVGLVYKIQYLNLILEIFSTMLSYSNIKILKKKNTYTAATWSRIRQHETTSSCLLPHKLNFVPFLAGSGSGSLIHIYHGLGSYHPTRWEGLFIKLLLDNHLPATSQRFTWTCLKRQIYGRLQRKSEESPNLWWLGFGFRGNFPVFLEKPNQPTNTIILWDSKILLHKSSPTSSECIHCIIMAERGQKVAFLL